MGSIHSSVHCLSPFDLLGGLRLVLVVRDHRFVSSRLASLALRTHSGRVRGLSRLEIEAIDRGRVPLVGGVEQRRSLVADRYTTSEKRSLNL